MLAIRRLAKAGACPGIPSQTQLCRTMHRGSYRLDQQEPGHDCNSALLMQGDRNSAKRQPHAERMLSIPNGGIASRAKAGAERSLHTAFALQRSSTGPTDTLGDPMRFMR